MPDQSLYQTVARCDEIHDSTKRWLKMLTWLMVLLSGLMFGAAQQSYSASSRSRGIQIELEAQKSHLNEMLSQIKDDMREIRQSQRELLLMRPRGGGG